MVLSHYELSGVTTNTIDLCEGLAGIGHKVTLIVGKPELPHQLAKQEYLNGKGVETVNFPAVRSGIVSRIKTTTALCRLLSSSRYDIIHMESIYLIFIPKLLHKRFTLTYHSYGLKNNLFSQRATRLIAISKEIKQDAIERHGYKPENVDIVLHGVSRRFAEEITEQQREGIRTKLGIPNDKIAIGIVGSVQPRKGHHFLLEAIADMAADQKDKVHLVFCGDPVSPECGPWIEEQINKFGLRSQVTRIGHCDPLAVYQSLDIFCLPSVWEGFGLVVVEAMLAGCCVVRSNVQGATEQISEDVTGYTFQTESPVALREVLEKLVMSPKTITEVGKNAREAALARFTLETMAQNTVETYRKVIGAEK